MRDVQTETERTSRKARMASQCERAIQLQAEEAEQKRGVTDWGEERNRLGAISL